MQRKKQPTMTKNLDGFAMCTLMSKILSKHFPLAQVHLFADM